MLYRLIIFLTYTILAQVKRPAQRRFHTQPKESISGTCTREHKE